MGKLENVIARMEMQESGFEHNREESVIPCWEVAKDIVEDEQDGGSDD